MNHRRCFRVLSLLAAFFYFSSGAIANPPGDGGIEIWVDGPEEVQPGVDRGTPDAAVDPQGRSIFVWEAATSNRNDIFLRRFGPGGNPLEDPIQANTLVEDDQRSPRLAVSFDGSFLVIWQSEEPDPDANGAIRRWIRGQAFDPDANPVGPERLYSIISTSDGTERFADVAALVGGGYIVVWSQNSAIAPDTNRHVRGQRVLSNGALNGDAFVANSRVGQNETYAAVTELNDGGFFVVWRAGIDLYGRRFDSTGSGVGEDIRVDTFPTGAVKFPDVARGVDGRVLVVWQDAEEPGEGEEIRGRLYSPNLIPQGDDFRINNLIDDGQSRPRVGSYGKYGFLVAWESLSSSSDPEPRSIEARTVTGFDEFGRNQFTLNKYTTGGQSRPGVGGMDEAIAVAWASPSNNESIDDVITGQNWSECGIFCNSFETGSVPGPSVTLQLDCVQKEYPCSLAEADPDALARTLTLMQELWTIRDQGTMDDVRAYLESQPDVVDIGTTYRSVSFRVNGMSPAVFDDITVVEQSTDTSPSLLNRSETQLKSKSRFRLTAIVGEDQNNDERVDQRDKRRALVLAPYEWQFAPTDESADLAARLETLPGYSGNVVFESNPTTEASNITLDRWKSFRDFDTIFISTHGVRNCEILTDLSNDCQVWISTGIEYDYLAPSEITTKGIIVRGEYDTDELATKTRGKLSLHNDFWRYYYNGELDNALVTFSACQTANFEGSELAATMGGKNFVMAGWTESVNTLDAFPTTLAFYEELAKGLTTEEAYQNLTELNLFPVTNSDGVETSFEVFAPRNQHVRLFEIPRLKYTQSVMQDGQDISDLVAATVGDSSDDTLQLTLEVDGVTVVTKPEFNIRYRINELDIPGSYDLDQAILVDGETNRYQVDHEVALGFPVEPGLLPIEVIAELPEGGESRFSVVPQLSNFNLQLDDCARYEPTMVSDSLPKEWSEPNKADTYPNLLSTPSDVGGGFWQVTISTESPVSPYLFIGNPNLGGAITAGTAAATSDEQSRKSSFLAYPNQGYTVIARSGLNAPRSQYPWDYNLSYSFQSRVDCYEPNDRLSAAKWVPMDQDIEAYALAGYIDNTVSAGAEQTYDWYKFQVQGPDLRIELLKSPTDIRMTMTLFRAENLTAPMDFVETQAGGANNTGRLFYLENVRALEPGVYFLQVHHDFATRVVNHDTPIPDHWNTKYQFRITAP